MMAHKIRYPGNKGIHGIAQKIINEIPKCDVFRELFAGSGAISSMLDIPEAQLHLNDKAERTFQDLRFAFPSRILTNECAIKIIECLPPKPQREEVIFLDPPYRHCTRTNTVVYDCEMTDADHAQLLSAVVDKENEYRFMIIHPVDDMYAERLAHWRKKEIKVRYHRKTQVEILYMNYDPPTQLQDYKFLGDDRHDRQRIKRKGDRIVKKLLSLPETERQYILDRLRVLNPGLP